MAGADADDAQLAPSEIQEEGGGLVPPGLDWVLTQHCYETMVLRGQLLDGKYALAFGIYCALTLLCRSVVGWVKMCFVPQSRTSGGKV